MYFAHGRIGQCYFFRPLTVRFEASQSRLHLRGFVFRGSVGIGLLGADQQRDREQYIAGAARAPRLAEIIEFEVRHQAATAMGLDTIGRSVRQSRTSSPRRSGATSPLRYR